MSSEQFIYPDMTPELEAYITACNLPRKPVDITYQDPEWRETLEKWNLLKDTTRKALKEGEYEKYRTAFARWYCREENKTQEKTHTSPCGTYTLKISNHTTGKNSWDYTKGIISKDKEVLFEVYRNYSSFPYAWLLNHAKGDFMLCGENYQGQTVLNLKTGERVDSLPPEAGKGCGFCWADMHPNKDNTLLAVDGCYWACPFEVLVYDISDPMSLPYSILYRHDGSFKEWLTDTSCSIGYDTDFVNLPGHPLHDRNEYTLSLEEINEADAECTKRFEAGLIDEETYNDVGPWREAFDVQKVWTLGED